MGVLRKLRIIGAALLGRSSPLPYRVSVPAGWSAIPGAGNRHYDEYRSPDDQSHIRVFSYEASAATLEDMIEQDLAGIRSHVGALIEAESSMALKDGTPAHRIDYTISAGAESRHGIDVMVRFEQGAVLFALVSDEPIAVPVMDTFRGVIDSLDFPGEPG
jgi:hypothetical protein